MKRWLLIVGISLVLVMFVYPSAFIYPKDTLPDNNDTRLISYIIGQVQKNIIEHNPLHYGTFFAPDQNTLTYSDLFLTSSIITLPFRFFTSHPIIIFNFALIIGFFLTIITSFILFEYLFKDLWTTTLSTILFNFSGFHLAYLPHLQIFALWMFCLSIYFFLRYLKEDRKLFLYLLFFSITLQFAESIFPVYLIFFACLTLFIFFPPPSRSLLEGLKQIAIRSIPFIPIWLLLVYPYLKLHFQFAEASRPIRDAAHFSLGLEEIFTKYHSWTLTILFLIPIIVKTVVFFLSNTVHVLPGNHSELQKHGIFLSRKIFATRLKQLRTAGVSRLWFPWKNVDERSEKKWIFVFLFSLIMSLGPVLKIFGQTIKIFGFPIPLPYTLFYYLFPGFQGFRTPSRFIVLALLSAVIIIGLYLKPIFKKISSKTKIIFLLLTLSLLFLEADLPLRAYPININTHPVYQEVKNLPPEAIILELPIKLWNMPDHEIESVRSLYSLTHNHRRFGGFSGFATNDWIKLVESINYYGLNSENISKLKSLGVSHVIENNHLITL